MIDLRPQFKHLHWRPMPHSFGVEVASDWADKADDDPVYGPYKQCGLWTMDEANILYECAKQIGGAWIDIGAHTGWTTAHLLKAGCGVLGIDKAGDIFVGRFNDNVGAAYPYYCRAASDFFVSGLSVGVQISGAVIDADHDSPAPVQDAMHCRSCLGGRGAILLHDAIGKPVQDAVIWLVKAGLRCKVYLTPHVVAVCWRGEFTPPPYEPFPEVIKGVTPHLGEIARFV